MFGRTHDALAIDVRQGQRARVCRRGRVVLAGCLLVLSLLGDHFGLELPTGWDEAISDYRPLTAPVISDLGVALKDIHGDLSFAAESV